MALLVPYLECGRRQDRKTTEGGEQLLSNAERKRNTHGKVESISGEFLGCGSVRGVNETISLTVRCNTKCDACEIVILPFHRLMIGLTRYMYMYMYTVLLLSSRHCSFLLR